jgi:hypothetical protein
MNKLSTLLFLPFFAQQVSAQSFHPAPDQIGTNAIYRDSSCFVSWATGGTLVRGFLDINDTSITVSGSNRASFGSIDLAFGLAEGDGTSVVSLGDSGIITLTFDRYIIDGSGYDFAVFENGFTDNYMEFAHVEVSSDGIQFVRFPSTSEIPTDQQLSNFSYSDCRMVNNLAGKYRAGFGTPFDLSELPDYPYLNKNAITHIRIIDAIGAISGTHITTDASGTIINDPYPTPFSSGGFDLDAVGIINGTVGIKEDTFSSRIFPNPATDILQIEVAGTAFLTLYTIEGKMVLQQAHLDSTVLSLSEFHAGMYYLVIQQNENTVSKNLIIR